MVRPLIGILIALCATIVGARLAFEASTVSGEKAASEPWAQSKMEFVAWNNERWTAWIRNDAFELVPQNQGKWHRHSNPTVAYIGWDGEAWQAKIDGTRFLLAHRGEWHGTVDRAAALRYRDWNGERELRTVEQLSR